MFLLVAIALSVPSARATSLSLTDETTLETGVILRQYRTSSPATNLYVLVVDLCADGVYLDATRAADSTQSTGSWGDEQQVTAATNGDFYKTDPLRVYGDAVGGGVRWPTDQTGLDPAYASEWYYEHAGWIAIRQDGLAFSHTGWVKENAASLGVLDGWENGDLRPDPPPGTIALVSGFPELVVEGVPMVCADPEASDCFPDRTDMRDRNPRTAMGFTEDRSTFFLVVADGRTSDAAGLYGSELADILGQLGAWEAFNLDGGGSSQLWTGSYVNDVDGNNSGSGTRSVANHWGIFAGGRSWLPDRPGHCATAPPCGTIPASGGEIDDGDACFQTFGPREYWREEADGYGGHLYWTNAWDNPYPDNWAWWRLHLEEAGTYAVSTYVEPDFSRFDDVEYEIVAGTESNRIRVDPAGTEGWLPLGTYDFAAGGEQWIAVYDAQDSDPGTDPHIAADAVRLERVGPWCGDGACDADEACTCGDCPIGTEIADNALDDDCDGAIDEPSEETGTDSGTGTGTDGTGLGETPVQADDTAASKLPGAPTALDGVGGCGCGVGGREVGGGALAPALLVGLALLRRGRRAP